MTTPHTQSRNMSCADFNKGDQVEVVTQGCDCFCPATVLRSPGIRKNMVFVEYQTLSVSANGNVDDCDYSRPVRFVRDHVEVTRLRPKLPWQLNFRFKVGDKVDAYLDNAWHAGTVMDILEFSKYLILFESREEEIQVEQCHLRLHRKWVDGSWVPPLPQGEKEKPFGVKGYSRKVRFTFNKAKFENGMRVEVRSDEEGYKGAWFIATIVDYLGNDKFMVEYWDLTTEDGSKRLREETYSCHIRPCPPQVPVVFPFREQQEVDAWYNDAWWEGVISQVLSSSEYLVYFIPTHEVLDFDISKLRIHQDWIKGEWAMRSKMLKSGNKKVKVQIVRNRMKAKFCKGLKVEVKSDEEGYQGSWFTAVIIELIGDDKCLVEYETLKTDNLKEQLREETDVSNIRPCPPDFAQSLRFALHDKVDAWFNEGWWEGKISRVLQGYVYRVYFQTTNEYLDFDHCHLRPHQEWVSGKWVVAYRD